MLTQDGFLGCSIALVGSLLAPLLTRARPLWVMAGMAATTAASLFIIGGRPVLFWPLVPCAMGLVSAMGILAEVGIRRGYRSAVGKNDHPDHPRKP